MNSKQVNETVNKLFSFMQDVKDGDLRTAPLPPLGQHFIERLV